MVPAFLEDVLYYATVTNSSIFVAFVVYFMWWFLLPNHALKKYVQKASEQKCAIFLKAINPTDKQKEDVISDNQERTIKEWGPWRIIHKLSDLFIDKFGWSIQLLGTILSWTIYLLIGYILYNFFS